MIVGLKVFIRYLFHLFSNPFRLENIKDVWIRLIGLIEDSLNRQSRVEHIYIKSALDYLRVGKVSEAKNELDSALNLAPYSHELYFLRASAITYLEADPKKLASELIEGVNRKREVSENLGLDKLKIRIIGDEFGGMHATILDALVKLKKLGLIDNNHIMIIRKSRVINEAYLECWRKYLPIVVTNDNNYEAIKLLFSSIFEEISIFDCKTGAIPLYEAHNRAINGWGETKPLLKLTDHELTAGQKILKIFGIEPTDWFVGLHVREGAKGGEMRSGPDSDISTYYEAIKRVTDRGGWVIRMGIGGTPLRPMDRVWDYANSNHQCDWMDVFLWAKCRFFIGTSSGPLCVPPTFGRPVLLTNATTLGYTLNYHNSMLIPKLLWSKSKNRYLTYREIFYGPYAWSVRPNYDDGDVFLVSNTPEELAGAVEEMFIKLENVNIFAKKTQAQMSFENIRLPFNNTSQGVLAESFLKLHEDLLY
jgi:putative glycosyltransferase (TIGR04372 family)